MECYHVVVGASRGIGLEFTKQLLGKHDNVIATYRHRPSEELAQLAKQPNLTLIELDINEPSSRARFCTTIKNKEIASYIHNAGVYGPKVRSLDAYQEQQCVEVFQTNVISMMMLFQQVEGLLKRCRTKVAILSSKMGSMADNQSGGSYLYRASKSAVNAFGLSLGIDLKPFGVTVILFHPGWVQTEMGGPNALITPEQSVRGMLNIIEQSTPEHNGQFVDYDNNPISW